ncbi:MAG TPA: ABC transporter substrate-binding protein [Allosphingosinicella sp.]
MATRPSLPPRLLAATLFLAACGEKETGPIAISAIGGEPRIVNPNLEPLDPPSAALLDAAAPGLVRFEAGGEIEPALAQRWIVSDDGLRYTFRLAKAEWHGGGRVTAEQAVARLRAAAAPASRNPVKPILGAIDEIVAMTDDVLEISLQSPRPNFLQLLAQPEMAIVRAGAGAGPYRAERQPDGSVRLSLAGREEEEEQVAPPLVLRGEPAAAAAARFGERQADLVLGGTLGDLPLARAAGAPAAQLRFDPVGGLLGLAFTAPDGPFARAETRQALAMAIDRPALAAAFDVPGLQVRQSLLPPGVEGLTRVSAPAWINQPLPARRLRAAALLREAAGEGGRLRVRVALPDGLGYRLIFARLRRDWAEIGIEAVRVGAGAPADLRLIDEVAPAGLASWYLRHFSCQASRVCDPAADEMMAAARIAPDAATRRALLANADRILAGLGPFIPLTAPVRWSLVAPRLTGFRPNAFGRHPVGELVREQP